MRRLLLLLSLPAAVALPAPASAQTDKRVRELDAFATQAVKDWRAPGLAMAVVRGDGRVIFAKGFGVLDAVGIHLPEHHVRRRRAGRRGGEPNVVVRFPPVAHLPAARHDKLYGDARARNVAKRVDPDVVTYVIGADGTPSRVDVDGVTLRRVVEPRGRAAGTR